MDKYAYLDEFPPFWKSNFIDEIENKDEHYFRGNDKIVLKQLCEELNQLTTRHNYRYLMQIMMSGIPVGSCNVVLKYIDQFESEACRAILMLRVCNDKIYSKTKIKDLDRIIMDLYHHFRASSYYVVGPGTNRSKYIYGIYDKYLEKFKSRKILPELIELMKSRRELYILPFTVVSIAKKWKPEELEEILVNHLKNKNITRADVGIPEEGDYHPTAEIVALQTAFVAIGCLEHYPSPKNVQVIMEYADHPDEDLAKCARESAEKMRKKLQEMQA